MGFAYKCYLIQRSQHEHFLVQLFLVKYVHFPPHFVVEPFAQFGLLVLLSAHSTSAFQFAFIGVIWPCNCGPFSIQRYGPQILFSILSLLVCMSNSQSVSPFLSLLFCQSTSNLLVGQSSFFMIVDNILKSYERLQTEVFQSC